METTPYPFPQRQTIPLDTWEQGALDTAIRAGGRDWAFLRPGGPDGGPPCRLGEPLFLDTTRWSARVVSCERVEQGTLVEPRIRLLDPRIAGHADVAQGILEPAAAARGLWMVTVRLRPPMSA